MNGVSRKRQKDSTERQTAPSVGQGDMSSIPKIDLDMHSDAIGHWQDEPQPATKEGRDRKDAGRSDRKH